MKKKKYRSLPRLAPRMSSCTWLAPQMQQTPHTCVPCGQGYVLGVCGVGAGGGSVQAAVERLEQPKRANRSLRVSLPAGVGSSWFSVLQLVPQTQPVAQTSHTSRRDPCLHTTRVWGVWLLCGQSRQDRQDLCRLTAYSHWCYKCCSKSARVVARWTTSAPDPLGSPYLRGM
jgi:hypothetical protein